MDLELKGKVIVVGGGAGGIGTVVCEYLRNEGAIVEVADIKDGINLGDSHIARSYFDELHKKHAKIDGYCSLVYGGGGLYGVLESPMNEIVDELTGTLLAAVFPIQEAARWMIETGGGSIVVVSSINSVLGLNEFSYDLAKGALNRIAPDLAVAHGKDGIYATTLLPGTVCGTPSWEGKEYDLKNIAEWIPDQKVTRASEVATMIAFLLSPHARMLNGSEIIADRGWHLKPQFRVQTSPD